MWNKILVVLTGGLTLYHIVLLIQTIQRPTVVEAVHSIPAWLQMGMALGWMVLFGWLALMVRRSPEKTVRWTLWMMVFFAIYRASRLFIFAQSDYDRGRLPFLGLLLLVFIVIVLTVDHLQGEQIVE